MYKYIKKRGIELRFKVPDGPANNLHNKVYFQK